MGVEHIPSRPPSLLIRPLTFVQSQISRHSTNSSCFSGMMEAHWGISLRTNERCSRSDGSGQVNCCWTNLTSRDILGSEFQRSHQRVLLPHEFGSLDNLSNPTIQSKAFNSYISMLFSNICLQLLFWNSQNSVQLQKLRILFQVSVRPFSSSSC
jgi:hypothetical protein